MLNFKGSDKEAIEQIVRVASRAIGHFGISIQLLKLTEECGELTQAIAKYWISSRPRATETEQERDALQERILDEIADVLTVIAQIVLAFGDDKVIERVKDRFERLEQRIINERAIFKGRAQANGEPDSD